MCKLSHVDHFGNEPILACKGCLRVVIQEAGRMEVQMAVRRHRVVTGLEGHVAAAVDAHAPVVDGDDFQHLMRTAPFYFKNGNIATSKYLER